MKQKQTQKQKLLLLEDVDALGKKGEIVSARPGYIRNFLLPRGCGVIATPNVLRKQEKLKEEREAQGKVDREEALTLAAKISTLRLETKVKVDPEGRMYGSVTPHDIVRLFQEMGVEVERKYILLTKPIKETGEHPLQLKLKEGVMVSCPLHIIPEGVEMKGIESVVKPIVPEEEEKKAEKEPPAE